MIIKKASLRHRSVCETRHFAKRTNSFQATKMRPFAIISRKTSLDLNVTSSKNFAKKRHLVKNITLLKTLFRQKSVSW